MSENSGRESNLTPEGSTEPENGGNGNNGMFPGMVPPPYGGVFPPSFVMDPSNHPLFPGGKGSSPNSLQGGGGQPSPTSGPVVPGGSVPGGGGAGLPPPPPPLALPSMNGPPPHPSLNGGPPPLVVGPPMGPPMHPPMHPGGPMYMPQPALLPSVVPGGPPTPVLLMVVPVPGKDGEITHQQVFIHPAQMGMPPAMFPGAPPAAAKFTEPCSSQQPSATSSPSLESSLKRSISSLSPKRVKRRRGDGSPSSASTGDRTPPNGESVDPAADAPTDPLKALLLLLSGGQSRDDPRWPSIAAAAASALPPELLAKINEIETSGLDDTAASQAVLNQVLQAMLLVSGSIPGGPSATGPGTPDAPSPADVAQVALSYLARARSRPDVIAHLASVTKASANAERHEEDDEDDEEEESIIKKDNVERSNGPEGSSASSRSRFLESPLYDEQWGDQASGGESGDEDGNGNDDGRHAAAAAASYWNGRIKEEDDHMRRPPGVPWPPGMPLPQLADATVEPGGLAAMLARTLRGGSDMPKCLVSNIKTHGDLVRGAVEGLRLKQAAESMEVNFSAKQGQRSATATVFDGCSRAALINKRTLRSAKRDERGLRVRVFPQGLWLRQEVNGELKSPEDVKEPGRRLKPVSAESDLKVAVLIGLAFSRLRILLHPDWVRRELWPETGRDSSNGGHQEHSSPQSG